MYLFIQKPLKSLGCIANRPNSTEREKVGHGFLIYTGTLMSLGGLLWGIISFFSGLQLESLIPFSYTLITIFNFMYLNCTKRFKVACVVQMSISVLLPFFFQLTLGGFIPSGAIILWSILSILVAFTFHNRKTTIKWFLFYLSLIIALGIIEAKVFVVDQGPVMDLSTLFFTLNLCVISTIIFVMFYYFVENENKLRATLEALALTDPLTNIPNRRYIFNVLEGEFKRVKRKGGLFSVMMVDIDYFKMVNDQYGHGVGDEVLKLFAEFLSESIREMDSVARYGGEEFIIFLPDTSVKEALTLGQRINQECRSLTHDTPIGECKFTISIGISVSNEGDKHVHQVINRADEALYKAKRNGRDRVEFNW